jgi:hypothetical protein
MLVKKAGTILTPVIVFLFDDIILIAKVKKNGFVLLKHPIPLEETMFIDKPDSDGLKNLFQIYHMPHEAYTLQGKSAYDKTSWMLEAESTRSMFCSMHYKMEIEYIKSFFTKYRSVPNSNSMFPPRKSTTSGNITPARGSARMSTQKKPETLLNYISNMSLSRQSKHHHYSSEAELRCPSPGDVEKVSEGVQRSPGIARRKYKLDTETESTGKYKWPINQYKLALELRSDHQTHSNQSSFSRFASSMVNMFATDSSDVDISMDIHVNISTDHIEVSSIKNIENPSNN